MSLRKIYFPDRNVSPVEFKDDGILSVIDLVGPTLQGEGKFAGTPCIFLRLAGCNRGAKDKFCHFCDTSFSLENPKTITQSIDIWATKTIELMVKHSVGHLVISGGEPLLQWKSLKNFLDRINAWKEENLTIDIESNGDFLDERILKDTYDTDWENLKINFVCSPKISHGTFTKFIQADTNEGWHTIEYSEKARYHLPKLIKSKFCDGLGFSYTLTLKLLVEADPNSPYHVIPEWASEWQKSYGLVYLSPIMNRIDAPENNISNIWDGNIDTKSGKANCAYAAQKAIEHGFRVSLQTHLLLGCY